MEGSGRAGRKRPVWAEGSGAAESQKVRGGGGTILLFPSIALALSVCYLRFSSMLNVDFSKRAVFRELESG